MVLACRHLLCAHGVCIAKTLSKPYVLMTIATVFSCMCTVHHHSKLNSIAVISIQIWPVPNDLRVSLLTVQPTYVHVELQDSAFQCPFPSREGRGNSFYSRQSSPLLRIIVDCSVYSAPHVYQSVQCFTRVS